MENQSHTAGERVEKFCAPCGEQLGHIVKSITKQGKISRVICSKCGLVGTFKASAITTKMQNLATKTASPYEQSKTYRTGQVLAHPAFGTGEVMTVFDTKTIDVLFVDRVRRLIHSRA